MLTPESARKLLSHVPTLAARPGRTLALLAIPVFGLYLAHASDRERQEPAGLIEAAVVRGADRLLELQQASGTFAMDPAGQPDVAGSGRAASALLMAHEATGDVRYCDGARLTATMIVSRLGHRDGRSPGNLLFLAQASRALDQPAWLIEARAAWEKQLAPGEELQGARAAARLLARPNLTSWTDGAWRNFLLCRAAEEARIARAVGAGDWASEFALEAARTWAPKHDHAFWASAAAGMVETLSDVPGDEARRLMSAHRGLIESNELLPGVAWNETPYDTYVHASETAAVLNGLVARGQAEDRSDALQGAQLLVARQAPAGGWGTFVSLVERVAADGDEEIAAADLAEGESTELDAEIVQALARVLGAT